MNSKHFYTYDSVFAKIEKLIQLICSADKKCYSTDCNTCINHLKKENSRESICIFNEVTFQLLFIKNMLEYIQNNGGESK
jgi:hypothetical protein